MELERIVGEAMTACSQATGIPCSELHEYLCEFRPLDAGTLWDKRRSEVVTAIARHVGTDPDAVSYSTLLEFIEPLPCLIRADVLYYLAP